MDNRIIVFRTVTSNYCVSTHLKNTLLRVPANFHLIVLGDDVEKFSNDFVKVTFKNIPLKRNFHLINDIISVFLIGSLIIKYRPKVVHSLMTKAGLYSAILSFILRVDVRVHTFTGQIWATRKGFNRFLLKTIDKVICNLNTHCFTDSKSQSEYLFNNGISHNKDIIPYFFKGSISGVDLDKFKEENLISERKLIQIKYNLNITDFVIGYIARKSIDKGCIDMLLIFSQLLLKVKNINVKLFFIGPDESNGEVTRFYKLNPLILNHIIDLGFVNNHHEFLSACNLMCLPSHREGFGSIVIDAAAIGIPTIGYNIPGLVDSISNNYSGILVREGNIDIFVNEIIDLINNPGKLKQMSLNARKYALENFDTNLVNQEMFEFYLNGK